MLKLLEALPFVQVRTAPEAVAATTPAATEALRHVEQGFRELKLLREGKLEAQPIEKLFDEVSN